MKKFKYIYLLLTAAVIFVSCQDKKILHDKDYYARYVPNRSMYGLKENVKEYEVINYLGSQWDNENETIVPGQAHSKTVYRFDENGTLTEINTFAFESNGDTPNEEIPVTTAKYTYDELNRVSQFVNYDYQDGTNEVLKEKEVYEYDYADNKVAVNCFSHDNSSKERQYTVVMKLDNDGCIINRYPSDLDGKQLRPIKAVDTEVADVSGGNIMYESITKYDTKGNITESVEFRNSEDDNDTNKEDKKIRSYKKMALTYYDGPAAEGKTVKRTDIADARFTASILSDRYTDNKNLVSSITMDNYTGVGNGDNGIDTLANVPGERTVYKYDKKGLIAATETWNIYRQNKDTKAALYLAQEEEYKYDSKLRKTAQVTKKYLPPVNGETRSSTVKNEEIKYDDAGKKATHLTYITYCESGSEQMTKREYELNDEGYIIISDYKTGYVTPSNTSKRDAFKDADGDEKWYRNYDEDIDKHGNWNKRTLSYSVYDNAGKLKEHKVSDYRTRDITYY